MSYSWVTEWNGYNLSYGTGSADAFHREPSRSFNYVGNTPLTGYATIGESKKWKIDTNNFILFNFNSSSSWDGQFIYNGSVGGSIAFSGSGYNRTDILMMVDEVNERCAIYEICYRANDGLSFIFVLTSNNTQEHNAYLLYLLGNVPPIVYTWQSVPSISGKNGISLLSIIKSSAINGGDAVSGASADAFDSLESTSKLSTLASGKTEETPVIYSDDENYLAIKNNGDNTCDLRFYLEGQSLLKIQNASQNAYLSILEDDTNQVVKPSIIYKSGNTYSYNTESPSSDTMENLYNWLHIQTRKKENKTGRWSTSFSFSRVEE